MILYQIQAQHAKKSRGGLTVHLEVSILPFLNILSTTALLFATFFPSLRLFLNKENAMVISSCSCQCSGFYHKKNNGTLDSRLLELTRCFAFNWSNSSDPAGGVRSVVNKTLDFGLLSVYIGFSFPLMGRAGVW